MDISNANCLHNSGLILYEDAQGLPVLALFEAGHGSQHEANRKREALLLGICGRCVLNGRGCFPRASTRPHPAEETKKGSFIPVVVPSLAFEVYAD